MQVVSSTLSFAPFLSSAGMSNPYHLVYFLLALAAVLAVRAAIPLVQGLTSVSLSLEEEAAGWLITQYWAESIYFPAYCLKTFRKDVIRCLGNFWHSVGDPCFRVLHQAATPLSSRTTTKQVKMFPLFLSCWEIHLIVWTKCKKPDYQDEKLILNIIGVPVLGQKSNHPRKL